MLGEDVTRLARESDGVAVAVLEEAGRWLGIGLAGFVNVFNPEVIAVGGGVMAAGELILEAAREEVRLRARPPSRDLVQIKEDTRPESGVLGAAALARDPPPGSTCWRARAWLVVVPTPIGNLEDITLRALRVLSEADLVACEDTRRTGRLLAHHGIKNDLVSYHEHNEERLTPELAERARTQEIALASDAGMPLVSDPGYRLVSACIEKGVDVEVLPGPSAPITASSRPGCAGRGRVPRFPASQGQGTHRAARAYLWKEEVNLLFESPHRLGKTLGDLPPETPVAVCRELTKLHEEVFRGTAAAARRFSEGTKGEIVLVAWRDRRRSRERRAGCGTGAGVR